METIKRKLRRACLQTRLRGLAERLHPALVAAELAGVRAVDRLVTADPGSPSTERDLTAIVKTFERPCLLERLVRSIRRLYPRMRIVVADDSRRPSRLAGVDTLALPHDVGVSEGRNRALSEVRTPYVLNLDDDFIFYRRTDLTRALSVMQRHRGVDIVGGNVVYLPLLSSIDYGRWTIYPTSNAAPVSRPDRIGGLPVYDAVPNFFVGRTESVRAVGWDGRLKRLDHRDFFTRARGVLTTVFDPDLRCLHAGSPFDAAYMAHRMDVSADLRLLEERYYTPPGA